MGLNFLTGTPTTQPSAMSWMNPSNNNAGMSFNSPAMSYQPGMTTGDYLSTGSNAGTGITGAGGLTGQLGMNIPTFQLGLDAIGSLANIYGGFQANKLAKDQLSFAKDVTNTNLNNQIKSYNTALEDRARSRATAENRDQASADAYIEANRLSR